MELEANYIVKCITLSYVNVITSWSIMIAEILSVENFIRDFVELTELNSFVFNLGLDFLCIVTLSVF